MEEIELFFSDKEFDGKRSSLAQARFNLNQLEDAGLHLTPAYVFCIWATVDLLSRFNSGQLDNQRATRRIKDFLRDHFPHQRKHTQHLVLFRNACIHSINLFASDAKGIGEMRFKLSNDGELFQQIGQTAGQVNVLELKESLEKSITRFYQQIEKDQVVKSRFLKVYKKLGYVVV